MPNRTDIEWVKNPDGTQGYTWNPITGCLNHTPEGLCLGGMFPCYAWRLANGRLRQRYLANTNIAGDQSGYKENVIEHLQDPFYPRFWEERYLDFTTKRIRHHYRGRRGIFPCDMSDLFGLGVPEQWTQKVLEATKYYPSDRFYLLTKQPQNLPQWSPFPDNCWPGVTATNFKMTVVALGWLRSIEAKVKYLSFEPLLDEIDLGHLLGISGIKIGWVIIGALTGTKYQLLELCQRWNIENKYRELRIMPYGKKWTLQPPIEWVEEIVEAADKAGVLVFQKDNLKPLLGDKLRQELP